MSDQLAQTTLNGGFRAACGACGAEIEVRPGTLLRRSVPVPGVPDVKELGVECSACGKRWHMGYTSGILERRAERIIKERDPVKRAGLQASYLRDFRRLQYAMTLRKQVGLLRGESA